MNQFGPRPMSGLVRLIRLAGFALLLQAACFVFGCAWLPPPGLIAPEVSLSEIRINEISLTKIRFSLNVAARNPNDVVLPLSRLEIDLEMLGMPFAKGRAKDDYFELPAGSLSTVPIEFVVPASRVRAILRGLSQGEASRFDYRVSGSANWGRDGVLLPFERKAEMQAMKRLFELLQR